MAPYGIESVTLSGPARVLLYRESDTMRFEIVGPLSEIEVIAAGRSVRQRGQLRRRYGGLGWRKLKGVGTVRLGDGSLAQAEIHWYEAHGIGRVRHKIKRFLE
jgi:hypothetical protein